MEQTILVDNGNGNYLIYDVTAANVLQRGFLESEFSETADELDADENCVWSYRDAVERTFDKLGVKYKRKNFTCTFFE